MFKWNWDRARLFKDCLEQTLSHTNYSKDFLERANKLGLKRLYDSTGNPNSKERFGFSLVFYKYYEDLQSEWVDFVCTVRNGFF